MCVRLFLKIIEMKCKANANKACFNLLSRSFHYENEMQTECIAESLLSSYAEVQLSLCK